MPKCRFCKKPDAKFKPTAKLSKYCDLNCFIGQGKIEAEKAKRIREKQERREGKERLAVLDQTVNYWRPKADTAFQEFCRLRDHDQPCISCGHLKPRMGKNGF